MLLMRWNICILLIKFLTFKPFREIYNALQTVRYSSILAPPTASCPDGTTGALDRSYRPQYPKRQPLLGRHRRRAWLLKYKIYEMLQLNERKVTVTMSLRSLR